VTDPGAGTVRHVRSADGTAIACETQGDGPAVVIVTGAFCDRQTTADLAALLSSDYTVTRYDRRGRGDSGDAATYAVEREIEDLAAVLDAAGPSPFVYGHSSGASLSLLGASEGLPMTHLVAYEPPDRPDTAAVTALGDALAAALADGDRAAAVRAFLLDAIGLPPEVVATAEHWPSWDGMCAIAHTLPYDLAIVGLEVDDERLARIAVPTAVLHGGNSVDWRGDTDLVPRIPGAVSHEVPGQDHGIGAEAIAPELRQRFVPT
jgi:pimeloyl-ACP methyl ester carboxylesterase